MAQGRVATPDAGLDPGDPLRRIAEAVRARLDLWGIAPEAGVTLLNHSENTTFRIDDPATGERRILRIHRTGYHSRAGIESELAWLDALRRDTDIDTAAPLTGIDGERVQEIVHAGLDAPRHAVMFSFLEGVEPSEEHDLPASFERLGEITARLHEHARAWTPEHAGFERPVWDFEACLGNRPLWGRWRDGMGMTPGREDRLGRLAEALRARLEAFGQDRRRFGLIHADLRLANLLLHGDAVRVIDFDDCGFGWYLYDLGSALSFIEHKDYVPELVAAWVRGYRKAADLSAEEAQELQTFILLRRLLLVAWIGSHAETELAQAMGEQYTVDSCRLAERYLAEFG